MSFCAFVRLAGFLFCASALAACERTPLFLEDSPAEGRLISYGEHPIKLKPGDRLRLTVYGEERLSGEYEIDPNGRLSMPLTGTVHAADLSAPELERLISGKLQKAGFIRDPKVSVEITNLHPFYVLGEVDKPGQYAYVSGLNVMSAIAVAGGYTFRASETRVLIQRAGEPDFQEYPLSPRIHIFPGDLIRVPQRYF
jgi:polysaccharide export outer membrane protein